MHRAGRAGHKGGHQGQPVPSRAPCKPAASPGPTLGMLAVSQPRANVPALLALGTSSGVRGMATGASHGPQAPALHSQERAGCTVGQGAYLDPGGLFPKVAVSVKVPCPGWSSSGEAARTGRPGAAGGWRLGGSAGVRVSGSPRLGWLQALGCARHAAVAGAGKDDARLARPDGRMGLDRASGGGVPCLSPSLCTRLVQGQVLAAPDPRCLPGARPWPRS